MAESNAKSKSQPMSSEQEKKLTSAQFDEFKESLELLYVIANLSARIQFAQKWPAAADFVLGEDLMEYDREGVKSHEDKEDRAELEKDAEAKRIALLEFLDTIEEKSVDKGALQIEYVKEAMTKLGRPLSLLIYGEHLVDRFLPASPDETKKEEGQADSAAGASGAPDAASVEPPPEMPSPETPPTAPVEGTAPQINPDGPMDVSPKSMSPAVAGAVAGETEGAPKIYHDPLDDVRPIDLQPPVPPSHEPPPEASRVEDAMEPPLSPEDIPPVEEPPQTVPKADVIQPLEGEMPHLAEEEAHNPIEVEQARVENDDPAQPLTPEVLEKGTPQPPPASILPPPPPPPAPPAPPAPETGEKEDDMSVHPAPDVEPPQALLSPPAPLPEKQSAPAAPASELTQKPVSMKFISSKDQQKKPEEQGGEEDKKDDNQG